MCFSGRLRRHEAVGHRTVSTGTAVGRNRRKSGSFRSRSDRILRKYIIVNYNNNIVYTYTFIIIPFLLFRIPFCMRRRRWSRPIVFLYYCNIVPPYVIGIIAVFVIPITRTRSKAIPFALDVHIHI